jgi:hypothetical protein
MQMVVVQPQCCLFFPLFFYLITSRISARKNFMGGLPLTFMLCPFPRMSHHLDKSSSSQLQPSQGLISFHPGNPLVVVCLHIKEKHRNAAQTSEKPRCSSQSQRREKSLLL